MPYRKVDGKNQYIPQKASTKQSLKKREVTSRQREYLRSIRDSKTTVRTRGWGNNQCEISKYWDIPKDVRKKLEAHGLLEVSFELKDVTQFEFIEEPIDIVSVNYKLTKLGLKEAFVDDMKDIG